MTRSNTDWKDVEEASRQMAGNWRQFDSFLWRRGCGLPDGDHRLIVYTSHRDAGLLAQSNDQLIAERLAPFSEGDDSDLVFERHTHFAFGYADPSPIRTCWAKRSSRCATSCIRSAPK